MTDRQLTTEEKEFETIVKKNISTSVSDAKKKIQLLGLEAVLREEAKRQKQEEIKKFAMANYDKINRELNQSISTEELNQMDQIESEFEFFEGDDD